MQEDEHYMRIAMQEAVRGVGTTSPNPMVGAVIVRAGRILAKGFHRLAGGPHAEIEALQALRRRSASKGSTMYVTLEPCSTHGRTGPCVEAILEAGIGRVVVAAIDPNPAHQGRGLELLRQAGVEVRSGVLAPEATKMNRAFNKRVGTGLPWVIAKAGTSLDGRLTRPPGEEQWLTSEASRKDAQTLRFHADAVLIGATTLRIDNPRLTLRDLPEGSIKRQPWRVVMTRGTTPLPTKCHLFTDEYRERTLIFRGKALENVFRELAGTYGVNTVLIEGGGEILGSAFDAGLVDEVCFYMAPLLCGGPVVAVGGNGAGSSREAVKLHEVKYQRIGDDLRMSGLVIPGNAQPAAGT